MCPSRNGVVILTSSLTETSWLRATLPSVPQSHQVACHILGRLLQNHSGGRRGANQQAGRLLTSFCPLTLALNSTDLISWWWERPGMNNHLVLCSGNVSKSHQSLLCLPKVYGVHLKKKTPWAPDITSLFGGRSVPHTTQRL